MDENRLTTFGDVKIPGLPVCQNLPLLEQLIRIDLHIN